MSVIDDYLQSIPEGQATELQRIRSVVKTLAPNAEETIGYGMPVFKVNGRYLIGMCAFKHHLSIFQRTDCRAER